MSAELRSVETIAQEIASTLANVEMWKARQADLAAEIAARRNFSGDLSDAEREYGQLSAWLAAAPHVIQQLEREKLLAQIADLRAQIADAEAQRLQRRAEAANARETLDARPHAAETIQIAGSGMESRK